jgi:hypothetical protein
MCCPSFVVPHLRAMRVLSALPPSASNFHAASQRSQRALDSYSRVLSGIEKSYRTTGRTSKSEMEGEGGNRHESDGLENSRKERVLVLALASRAERSSIIPSFSFLLPNLAFPALNSFSLATSPIRRTPFLFRRHADRPNTRAIARCPWRASTRVIPRCTRRARAWTSSLLGKTLDFIRYLSYVFLFSFSF